MSPALPLQQLPSSDIFSILLVTHIYLSYSISAILHIRSTSVFILLTRLCFAVNEVNMCSGRVTNILSGYIRLTSSADTNNYCQCTSVMGMSFGGTFTLTLTAEQASSNGLDDVCVTVFSHPAHAELVNQCFENGTPQSLTLVGDHVGGLMLTFRSVLGTLPPGGSTFSLLITGRRDTVDNDHNNSTHHNNNNKDKTN